MSSSFTDPEAPDAKSAPRPPIWAGGKQRARLDPRAFLRVSVSATRVWLAPRLLGSAFAAQGLSLRLANGDFAPLAERLGRAARIVPGRAPMASVMQGTAELLALASETVAGPRPIEPLPFRGWNGAAIKAPAAPAAPASAAPVTAAPTNEVAPVRERTQRPSPMPPPPVQAAPKGDQSTLDAIRSVIHLSEVAPARPVARRKRLGFAPPPPPEPRGAEALPDLEPDLPPAPGALRRLAGHALGYTLIGCAMPVGLFQATVASLKGEDLGLRD